MILNELAWNGGHVDAIVVIHVNVQMTKRCSLHVRFGCWCVALRALRQTSQSARVGRNSIADETVVSPTDTQTTDVHMWSLADKLGSSAVWASPV